MYARMTTLQVAPEQLDEVGRRFQMDAMPALEKIEGFRGLYIMADRASGKVIGIGLWETEAAMEASSAAVTALGAQALAGAGDPSSVSAEKLDVIVQPVGDEGQRLASAIAAAARELEGQVRRVASSDEVARLSRQVEGALRQFTDWARRHGGPSGGATPPTGSA
jgi:heme-degrading monooxygenase HmoA